MTNDFAQTWTILTQDFNGTFANINEVNGTFTALADLTTTITNDFAATWTILATGFNGTFCALNACCTNINSEFQQTWTILAAGFNGTFSAIAKLNADFIGYFLWTILAAGFNGNFLCTQCMLHEHKFRIPTNMDYLSCWFQWHFLRN